MNKCANGNLDRLTGVCLVNDQPCLGPECELYDKQPRSDLPLTGWPQIYRLLDQARGILKEIEGVTKKIENNINERKTP
jgi:hypothetical protein